MRASLPEKGWFRASFNLSHPGGGRSTLTIAGLQRFGSVRNLGFRFTTGAVPVHSGSSSPPVPVHSGSHLFFSHFFMSPTFFGVLKDFKHGVEKSKQFC